MRSLYRNSDDQWVAGVCGGLAKQFDVDPSIIRVLMALFCLSGGWGIILYAVLWIILPRKALGNYAGKRFFRDMNNRIIAGVCSGIAHYFAWDVRVVRLVFLAPVILALCFGIFSWPLFLQGAWYWSFFFQGSLVSSFAFAYILLWIILPPTHDIEPHQKSGSQLQAPPFVAPGHHNEDHDHRVSESVGQALGAIVRVFLLFLVAILIFCFFVVLMASLFAGALLWPLNGFIWTSDWQQYLALSVLIFFVGTPVLGFIIWLIRRASGIRFGSPFLRWTFGSLWLVGIASLILLIISIAGDFRYYDKSEPVALSIAQPPGGLMSVQVSGPALRADNIWILGGNLGNWDFSETTLKLPFVDIRVMKSKDSSFHVTILKFSAGRTRDDAKRRADKIEYPALYKNGVLDLGNGFSVHQESKYRFQNVFVDIAIPVGKKIRFDESAKQKLSRIEVHVKSGERWSRKEVEIRSEAFPWKTNANYMMAADGSLKEQ